MMLDFKFEFKYRNTEQWSTVYGWSHMSYGRFRNEWPSTVVRRKDSETT